MGPNPTSVACALPVICATAHVSTRRGGTPACAATAPSRAVNPLSRDRIRYSNGMMQIGARPVIRRVTTPKSAAHTAHQPAGHTRSAVHTAAAVPIAKNVLSATVAR